MSTVHKAPDGWKVRGFDNFVCGGPAYAHQQCSSDWNDVNCPQCLAKAELRRCNYCRKDTPTKDEDCTVCGLSKTNGSRT